MRDPAPGHLDETGAPCARHPAISQARLYQLALAGSRASSFHHDCASKLQGLVMALEELTERTEHGDPELIRAVETAVEASRELGTLLSLHRVLAEPEARAPVALGELIARAARRAGVAVRGTLPDAKVGVGPAAMAHALALALDVAAGRGRGRSVVASVELTATEVELALRSSPRQVPDAADALAVASFVIARDGGRLWCSAAGDRLMIRLPAG